MATLEEDKKKKGFVSWRELPIIKALTDYKDTYKQGMHRINNPDAFKQPAEQPKTLRDVAQQETALDSGVVDPPVKQTQGLPAGSSLTTSPTEPASINRITTNPKLRKESDGSLVKIVPDKPQAPFAAQPPPIQTPMSPEARESLDRTLAGQERYNADPANAGRTKLGYQPIPGSDGASILKLGTGYNEFKMNDNDPTPLADREPMQMIRGTTGAYSNQASPLTEYATRSEAQKQEYAPIAANRDTQVRGLESDAKLQSLKNYSDMAVAKERSRGDAAVQEIANKKPSTKEVKESEHIKASEDYTKAMLDGNAATAATIILNLRKQGPAGVAQSDLLLGDSDPEFLGKLEEIFKRYNKL